MTVNSYLVWDPRHAPRRRLRHRRDLRGHARHSSTPRAGRSAIFSSPTPTRITSPTSRDWPPKPKPRSGPANSNPPPPGRKTFKENAHFHLGDRDQDALTWGHSPGMTTFYLTGLSWPLAVVGDSDFRQLDGRQPHPLRRPVSQQPEKILTLPRDTVLACGHGPLTTLAQEKQHNPFFAR
jgi:hydroxyacylglutathione hydrolase